LGLYNQNDTKDDLLQLSLYTLEILSRENTTGGRSKICNLCSFMTAQYNSPSLLLKLNTEKKIPRTEFVWQFLAIDDDCDCLGAWSWGEMEFGGGLTCLSL